MSRSQLSLMCCFFLFQFMPAFAKQSQQVTFGIVDTLAKDTIGLAEVFVNQKQRSLEEQFEQKKAEYRKIYLLGDAKKPFLTTPVGVAININKLYNKFSRSGRRARHLQEILEKTHVDDQIMEIWMPFLMQHTDYKGDELRAFYNAYKPEVAWLKQASYYEMHAFLKQSIDAYKGDLERAAPKLPSLK